MAKGGSSSTTTQVTTQNHIVNVETNIAPSPIQVANYTPVAVHVDEEFLRPIADTFGPLADALKNQLIAVGQLNADLRRTATYPPAEPLASGSGGVFLLVAGGVVLFFLLRR